MTQEQIEAVKRELTAEVQYWQSLGPPMTRTEAHHQNSLATITALQARVDEAEATARLKAADAVKWAYLAGTNDRERREAETQLAAAQSEVARLKRENDELRGNRDYARTCATSASNQLATLRAAIAEAIRRADEFDKTVEWYSWNAAQIVAEPLRNLTKPDTPSERIMSDKDRENPVEGAHPTQPEGEDALVEETYAKLKRAWLAADYAEAADFVDEDNEAKAILRKALASRGLVRGEGVER